VDDIKIKRIAFTRDFTGLCYVRERVFIKEQGVPASLEWDGLDQEAIHLLAITSSQQPVGTVRMLYDGHIGRMAVLPEWRNQGIGQQLLMRILDTARLLGLKQVFLAAQLSAVNFYARYGFVPEGEVFLDAGIEHQTMRLTLSEETPLTTHGQ